MSEPEIVVRPFRPGDERAINDAFSASFGVERSLDEWSWKFPVEATGRLIMLAEQGGEPVAHYAAAPVRFAVDGRVWAAGQIVDVFSAPRVRGRRVWVQTAERFFDEFARSGRYPLLFGFPSPRHRELGVPQLRYVPLQPIGYLVRRPPSPAAGRRRLLYRAELARDWEPRLDELWRRVRRHYPVAVVRDAEWALRRLAGHPTVRYHSFLVLPRIGRAAVAYAAFRSDGGRCRWVDLLWDHAHPGALELLLHLSARLAVQTGAECEELWLNGDPSARSRLEAAGFEERPEPGGLVLVARAFDPEIDLSRVAGRVYITMADSDLV
jgi:hypothetical protein